MMLGNQFPVRPCVLDPNDYAPLDSIVFPPLMATVEAPEALPTVADGPPQ